MKPYLTHNSGNFLSYCSNLLIPESTIGGVFFVFLFHICFRTLREITQGNLIKGGGANGYFFVKLDFEIAVDQQTRTSDRTFEGVPEPKRQTVPAGQPRPYLVQIRPNLAKYPEHAQNPYFMCSTCS